MDSMVPLFSTFAIIDERAAAKLRHVTVPIAVTSLRLKIKPKKSEWK